MISWRNSGPVVWIRGMVVAVVALVATTASLAQPAVPDPGFPDAPLPALSPEEQGGVPWFRESAARDKYLLILTGAAATPEAGQRFLSWSADLYDVYRQQLGYAESRIILLAGDGEAGGPLAGRVDGSSRTDDIETAFAALRERTSEGDQLTVVMLGHGASRFGEARLNVVGPDITASRFAGLLDGLPGRDIVVVNASSASYPFSRALSAPGRVIVSATRSPAERYDTVFPALFIAALTDHQADLDRNGQLSVLEVFNYTRRSVAAWYSEQGRLATEHAMLDDTGDGSFTAEPGGNEQDGLLSEIAYLDVLHGAEAELTPEARALRSRMQELERAVVLLRGRKQDYLEGDYWARLEMLLVDLARATRRYNEIAPSS